MMQEGRSGIGVPELVILALLAAVAGLFLTLFIALFRGGRIRSALVYAFETRSYRELRPPLRPHGDAPAGSPRGPFPIALRVVGGLGAADLFLRTAIVPESAWRNWLLIAYLFATVCVLAALRRHLQPSHDRHLKYELLLIGVCCYGFVALAEYRDIAIRVGAMRSTTGAAMLERVWLLMNPAICLLALTWLQTRKVASPIAARHPRDLRHLRLVRRLAVPAAWAAYFHPFALIYFWSRYFVIDAFSRTPILYLRSFRYDAGPRAFGRIVSKTARWYGVPVAIVHQTQPASALQRFTSIADQAAASLLPDTAWQEWMLAQFDTAEAVILDASLWSESLAWELDAARDRLGADRIVVMAAQGSAHVLPQDLFAISYDLDDRDSVRRARRRLRVWFDKRARLNP